MSRKIIANLVIALFPLCLFADVLFGEGYFNSLHQSLNQAQKSITVAMYFIILEPEGTGPVNTIVNDLIAAKVRGVTVKVVLEDSKAQESRAAFEKLKASGLDVAFDTTAHLLHLKGIVVDSRYIFVGSANLSRAAIESNYEATAFYDAPHDAAALESYMASIPLNKNDIVFPAQEGVIIPADFLLSAQGGRILIENEADDQFDLYLLLYRIQKENLPIVIDYDSLAKELGFIAPTPLGKYRSAHDYYYEHVHRALAKLQRAGFIDYKNGVVTIRSLSEPRPSIDYRALSDLPVSIHPAEGGTLNEQIVSKGTKTLGDRLVSKRPDATFVIPFAYWQSGLPAKLSTRAKYMYLISLYEASRSTRYPEWFRSQKDMSALYGISDTTISAGFKELEQNHLIKITRDPLDPDDFSDRAANVYRMMPIVSGEAEQ